jgi:Fur family peroxide stress response transcriptional regulator
MVIQQEARVEELCRKLHSSGHRITPQRLCILQALVESNTHPSAEEIFAVVQKISPTTSLATVYKTLETLRDMGEVQELQPGDGRQHYDGVRSEFHPHVICTRCGEIRDVDLDHLSALPAQAQSASGYEIHTQRVEFYGLCTSCRSPKYQEENL